MKRTGSCVCGAVRFTARIEPGIAACHCQQCQRWSGGGPFFVAQASELNITGEDSIAGYHASAWGERGFCGTCGSNIYWRMQGGAITNVAVGLLDDQSGLHMASEIFVDYRPAWLPAWPNASQSTEAEEMAKLAQAQSEDQQ